MKAQQTRTRGLMGSLLATGTAVAGAGMVGTLAGIQHFLGNKRRRHMPVRLHAEKNIIETRLPPPPAPEPLVDVPLKASRHFSIKRTKSEVGYVYWILEGFGKYKCFLLCDSWDEAVAQAKAHLAAIDAADSEKTAPERVDSIPV